jgi:transcription elongation factor
MAITLDGTSGITTPGVVGNLSVSGNTTVGGTLTNTGLITASAGVAVGGVGAANTLDDYEEGTFTPNIGGTGVVYSGTQGVYRKIGNLVFIYLSITITTIGSPITTNSILGLPFAPAISNQHFGIAYYNAITNNTYELHGNFRSDSSIRVEGKGSFGTGQTSGINWAQNGVAIYGSGCYYT